MNRPEKDEIYRHFKGRKYRIICIAENTESGIEEVIYQGLYEPYKIYARDLDMFVSEVDRKKYPNEKQIYRFERIEKDEINNGDINNDLVSEFIDTDISEETADKNTKEVSEDAGEKIKELIKEENKEENKEETKEIIKEFNKEEKSEEKTEEKTEENKEEKPNEKSEKELNPMLRFFNCDDYESQIACLNEIKDQLDEKMLTNIEFSLGMGEQKGSVLDRYLEIKKYILIKQKYEKKHR